MKKSTQIAVFYKFIRRYFNDYGGMRAVIASPLFILSIIIAILSYRSWLDVSWPDLTMSVIPNLLGFSLGTYALLFSLISPRIRVALRALKNDRGIRYLDEMNATFLHFIIIQVCAFIWAFCYKQTLLADLAIFIAHHFPTNVNLFPLLAISGGIVGTVLIIYSVLLVIGSSLTVYRIARIVDPDQG